MNEFDAFQIAVYVDTTYAILKYSEDMSILKLAFFTYAVNKNRFFEKDVYTARNSRNVVTKEISTVCGDFDGFADAVQYIVRGIDILNRREIIKIEDGIAHIENEDYKAANCNKLSNFEKKAIDNCTGWSDKRFLREVLHNV